MTRKRSLIVLGKGLMPEVLPDPPRTQPGSPDPRERVRLRLREIAERAATMAAAAGISAACNSGYGVVDPLPPPYMCVAPNEFPISVVQAEWQQFAVVVSILPSNGNGPTTNTLLAGVSTTDKAMATVTSANPPFGIRLETAPGVWPARVDAVLAFTCSDSAGSKHYDVKLRLNTSNPAASGTVPYEMVAADDDAGI
jgi:hypothetical protein